MVQTPGQPGCQCKTPKFYRPCPRARTNTVFCAGAHPRARALPAGPGVRCMPPGVVLRAVLFVETVVGVGAMFWPIRYQWLATLVLLTGGVPPATLVWLGTACSLKTVLQRLGTAQQYAAGVVLGPGGRLCLAMPGWLEAWRPRPLARQRRSAGPCCQPCWSRRWCCARGPHNGGHHRAPEAELQSRIRPHFLFNTPQQRHRPGARQPAKAESLLEDLSDLFRHALVARRICDAGRGNHAGQRYLESKQVRLWPEVEWSLDPRNDGRRLPPLLLAAAGGKRRQARHWSEQPRRGGKLATMTELRGSRVVVRITNTLPPSHIMADDAPTRPRHCAGQCACPAGTAARMCKARPRRGARGLYQVRITLPVEAPMRRRTANLPAGAKGRRAIDHAHSPHLPHRLKAP